MYASIRGILLQSSPSTVVIEAGGIGFEIHIPASLFASLPPVGATLFLHTSFIVRELSQALYGFLTIGERNVFEGLMAVKGIGPKLALSLLGHMTVSELYAAISRTDLAALGKVPGIGKKTAERLILDLRDKLESLFPPTPVDYMLHSNAAPSAQKIRDAMSALISLGYNQAAAQKALKKTIQDHSEDVDLALLITHSLKHI